ncbi:hypothetical protein [Natronorubrum tibetense]|uniref:Ribbon-helix-helix protein CopG domain-containing protein n=1 Tax=Natronorubrum tibetense GA33 TaxID=1114856 RepID=L9VTE9_9EURY|nr:hypothetical protein [Natronorubrum tibetense]ELY40434.1 hypothetical protein C496_11303 [Natronorubrum tibetense GA33]
MKTISVRVSEELEADLEKLTEKEGLDRRTAVRKLLAVGLENRRRERLLERLVNGEITLTTAAERTELSVWEFTAFVEGNDQTWISSSHTEADIEAL